MTDRIRTVVIPAAGQGTRLLPATKTTPKELLNVYDRPALQFAIDEAVALGVDRIVIVLHPDKAAIRSYLAPAQPAQIAGLRACGKAALADALTQIDPPQGIEITYAHQAQPLGLGHAVLCAGAHILPGPVAVILPDDLILGAPCLSEMADHYTTGHMVAAMDVRPDETCNYGIFQVSGLSIGRSVPVSGMVEKPRPGQAPSRLAAVGRYILAPGIFQTLAHVPRGAGGEIQLTDAIARDAETVPITAFRFSGTRHDCGSHDGLLAAGLARQAMLKARAADEAHAKDRTTASAG